jgi:hypothetical protein
LDATCHARLAAEALDKGDLDLLLGHVTQHCEWKALARPQLPTLST